MLLATSDAESPKGHLLEYQPLAADLHFLRVACCVSCERAEWIGFTPLVVLPECASSDEGLPQSVKTASTHFLKMSALCTEWASNYHHGPCFERRMSSSHGPLVGCCSCHGGPHSSGGLTPPGY